MFIEKSAVVPGYFKILQVVTKFSEFSAGSQMVSSVMIISTGSSWTY